jgi:hypothetical protein
MSTLSDRIALLRKRATDIAAELTSLSDRRQSHALAASEGDTKALKVISDIDMECDDLARTHQTTLSAIETAEALAQLREVDDAQKAKRAHAERVYSTARGIIALNEEIDTELGKLAAMCERRQALLGELGRLEALNVTLLGRLSSRAPLTRAACAAGLHRYLSLEVTAQGSMVPLRESNAQLLIGQAPENDDEPKRVRLTSRVS